VSCNRGKTSTASAPEDANAIAFGATSEHVTSVCRLSPLLSTLAANTFLHPSGLTDCAFVIQTANDATGNYTAVVSASNPCAFLVSAECVLVALH
jgi:hypothetical protein